MIAEFLQPFWQATMAQEKHWASLDQVLYNMDILLKHFEDAQVSTLYCTLLTTLLILTYH
jgi:hypothetical protein